MKVTIIGLGKMGSALAERIQQAKFELTVFNRSPEKMQPFIKAGAKGAPTAKEAVRDADVVITSLFDDESVLHMVNSDEGFLSALKKDAIHLGTTTILPETSKQLADQHRAHGSIYIAGPVLGVPMVARQGGLTTFAAGDIDAIQRIESIVKTYSTQIAIVGDQPYQANVMKICANYLLAVSIEAIGEIYTFAEKSNADLDAVNKIFHTIYGHSAVKRYVDKVKDRHFDEVNFNLKGGAKDLSLFQKAFSDAEVVPALANVVKDKLTIALAQGLGDKDWSAFTEVTRWESGLK